jgi:hypothetical protein
MNMVHLDIYPKPTPQEMQNILTDLENSNTQKIKDNVAILCIMCIGLLGLMFAL